MSDGQETAGWMVMTWREGTMEAISQYNVRSLPWDSDTENDGDINGRDQNSNYHGYGDNLQVWVAFRTNAVNGDYSGGSTWVALIAPKANPYYSEQSDHSATVAPYVHARTTDSVVGVAQILNSYGPHPPLDAARGMRPRVT